MACILFVYARTSIRAAKANAQRHRDADSGGEGLSLLNESRRRHGVGKKIEGGGGTVAELGRQVFGRKEEEEEAVDSAEGRSGRKEEEETRRALRGGRGGQRGG